MQEKEHLIGCVTKDKKKLIAISMCGFQRKEVSKIDTLCEICKMGHEQRVDREIGNSEALDLLKKDYLNRCEGTNQELIKAIFERQVSATEQIRKLTKEVTDKEKESDGRDIMWHLKQIKTKLWLHLGKENLLKTS